MFLAVLIAINGFCAFFIFASVRVRYVYAMRYVAVDKWNGKKRHDFETCDFFFLFFLLVLINQLCVQVINLQTWKRLGST